MPPEDLHSGGPRAVPVGRAGSDFTVFLTLVKETGRFLRGFVAPDDFVPDAPRPMSPLSPEMIRHLGAPSLSDFYALALEDGRAPASLPKPPPLFPEGPESIKPAQTALEREIARLKVALEDGKGGLGLEKDARLLEIYRESRARLILAARLWPKIKKEALKWPEEAGKLWRTARRLEEGLGRMLKVFQAPADGGEEEESPSGRRRGASLTALAAGLKKEADAAARIIAEKNRLSKLLSGLSGDMEGLLAAAVEGLEEGRDWAEVKSGAERRLDDLRLEAARLNAEAARTGKTLAGALEALAEAEEIVCRDGGLLRGRLETARRGVSALLDSTLDRRRALAGLYFVLPASLGRPVFLEKTHLVAAASLGRAQSLLEGLLHRLTLAMGRVSSTHKLRLEAGEAAETLAALTDHESLLILGEGRLAALGRAVDQRLALKRVLSRNAEAETELSRARLDNDRLGKHLKTAALESERLREELAAARRGLGEMGRFKAKLLKIYGQKTALLQEAEKSRQKLLLENAELKTARAELKRKRARLAAMYKLENDDLKRLSREFGEQKDELTLNRDFMAAREEERRELEKRLEGTRLERDRLAGEQRELAAKTSGLEEGLADSVARGESLSAEVFRLGEELAAVTRARLSLGERLSAMRRKLDLLLQAQAALKKNLSRKSARLSAAERERDRQRDRLTRQNENILRLVGVRQELRAELGRARLRLSDLEKERDGLLDRLAAVRLQADEAAKAGEILKSRVGGLESENSRLLGRVAELSGEVVNLTETRLDLSGRLSAADERKAELGRQLEELEGRFENDLAPLIKIMGQALWRSEAARRRTGEDLSAFQAESGRMMEEMRLSADVREANLRLQAAARELDLGEAAQAERRRLSQSLEERAVELAAAQSRASRLESQLQALEGDRDRLFQRDQELGEAVARLGSRKKRLRLALDTLKQRYEGRLDEARAAENDLRGLIDSQNQELERQRLRLGELEPLVTHFLEQAESGLENPDDLALLRRLRGEAWGPLSEAGEPERRLSGILISKLAELQPLVAFLARSFVSGLADLARARQEGLLLAEQLKEAISSREILESSLDSRQGELLEMRDQAFELTRERDQLKSGLVEKDNEIRLLKTELAEADRDLAENDGRLEAAWAGLNYLGAKAGDNLAQMKARLENQTRKSDQLSLELKNRQARVRELEDRQNRLALLYWVLVSKAAGSENLLAENFPAPPDEEPVEIEVEPEIYPSGDESGERDGRAGRDWLEAAGKASRHGLLTLLLAGGLILGGPAAGAASPGESCRLSANFESAFVGRQVSLDFVEPGVRIRGVTAVEGRVKEKVGEVARGHSLSSPEFLRLLRRANAPETLVHLGDFEGPAGVPALLAGQSPKLAEGLMGRPEDLVDFLKAASSFRPEEGVFWERLYFNLAEKLEPADSLAALVKLLKRGEGLAARPQPEFAGRLAPFPEVENMGPATFIKFMGGHVNRHWLPSGRGRAATARRLAGDLYFAARLHKLPPTFLAAALHQELEEGRAEALFDGRLATVFMYKKAAELSELVLAGGEIWQTGRAPLCDLDEILAEKYGPAGMESVFRKKMKIVMSYNKMTSQTRTLFQGGRA